MGQWGNGFGVANSKIVHLGLGREQRVNLLEVRWPSGLRQSFKTFLRSEIEIAEGKESPRQLTKFRSGILSA